MVNFNPQGVPPVQGTETNASISDDDKKKKSKKTEDKTEIKPSAVLKNDNINISNPPKDNNISTEGIKLFDSEKSDPTPNPWKVKTVHFNAGYMINNNVIPVGPMHIVNENYGTDLTITGFKQIDRRNWDSISFKKGERFAPDEPQFNLGANVTFENNFGVELDAKHNKIIMADYDQVVHFQGMMNGTYVNQDAPLNSFLAQHEHTYGNMQVSVMGTYTFDLPAPKNNKFSFITKAGPSLVTVASHSQIKNPQGEFEGGESKVTLAGYGGIVENGLRYQFGPKVGRLGVELTHSLSYLNYAKYPMNGGYTGSNVDINNSFALKLTVGLYGNKK
jgi:hypothetical protein